MQLTYRQSFANWKDKFGSISSKSVLIKPLLLVLVSIIASFICVLQTQTTFDVDSYILDSSWFMEMTNQLQKGHILGRDIFFTYGPLSQFLAWSSTILITDKNPIYTLGIGNTVFRICSAWILAFILWILPQVRAKSAVCIYVLFIFFCPFLPLRSVFSMAAPIVFAAALDSSARKRRVLAIATGLLWFLSQLLTFELLIFGVASGFLFTSICIATSFYRWPRLQIQESLLKPRIYLETFSIGLIIAFICNCALEVIFRYSSSSYTQFEYIRISTQIARSYLYTMGLDWELAPSFTFAFLLLCLYCFGWTIKFALQNKQNYYFLGSMLVYAFVSFKGAVVRSDYQHIFYSASPLIFLTLIIFYLLRNKRFSVYIGLFCLLLFPSYIYGEYSLLRSFNGLEGDGGIVGRVQAFFHPSVDIRSIAPKDLEQDITPNKSIFNFPYDNLITFALKGNSFAPILQPYSASDMSLQEWFVGRVESEKQNLQIIYGMDQVAAWQIDTVQHISRSPLIFKYIYEHFELRSDKRYRDGYVLLQPSVQAKTMLTQPIESQQQTAADKLSITTPKGSSCTILAMDLTIRYPITVLVGKPSHLSVKVFDGDHPLVDSDLVALEVGQPFTTYVYIGESESFYRVFRGSKQPVIATQFDRIELAAAQGDFMTVEPNHVEMSNLRCVQLNFAQ